MNRNVLLGFLSKVASEAEQENKKPKSSWAPAIGAAAGASTVIPAALYARHSTKEDIKDIHGKYESRLERHRDRAALQKWWGETIIESDVSRRGEKYTPGGFRPQAGGMEFPRGTPKRWDLPKGQRYFNMPDKVSDPKRSEKLQTAIFDYRNEAMHTKALRKSRGADVAEAVSRGRKRLAKGFGAAAALTAAGYGAGKLYEYAAKEASENKEKPKSSWAPTVGAASGAALGGLRMLAHEKIERPALKRRLRDTEKLQDSQISWSNKRLQEQYNEFGKIFNTTRPDHVNLVVDAVNKKEIERIRTAKQLKSKKLRAVGTAAALTAAGYGAGKLYDYATKEASEDEEKPKSSWAPTIGKALGVAALTAAGIYGARKGLKKFRDYKYRVRDAAPRAPDDFSEMIGWSQPLDHNPKATHGATYGLKFIDDPDVSKKTIAIGDALDPSRNPAFAEYSVYTPKGHSDLPVGEMERFGDMFNVRVYDHLGRLDAVGRKHFTSVTGKAEPGFLEKAVEYAKRHEEMILDKPGYGRNFRAGEAFKKTSSLKMSPLDHQKRVSGKLHGSQGVLVYHGLGSGKTFSAINAAQEHNLPLIAITPASLRNNFKKEIEASGFKGPSQVMSYEEATKRMEDPGFKEQASRSLVVFDEAHRMGRSESQRSRLPKKILGAKTMLLTGTPMRNRPEELMPILGGTDPSLRIDPKEFSQRFITKRQIHPGFFAALRGVKPGEEEVARNLGGFERLVQGKVDYHEAYDPKYFPKSEEEIIPIKMSPTQQDAYKFIMNKYPTLAYKIKHGIPPSKQDMGKMQSFLTGPRQIANTPKAFAESATPEDAVKIQRAADEIIKHQKEDKNFRGVVYSTYLGAGIDPMAEELERRGVNHIKFTGRLGDKEKKQAVMDYNTGKAPVMLISGAGAEGLDLKGTKLMQIMEPHWNEELINQVKGRAIRYKSHAHLPEEERKVKIQRFHAVTEPGKFKKFIKDNAPDILKKIMPGTFADEKSADEYLYDMSMKKQKLNEQFLNILKKQQ